MNSKIINTFVFSALCLLLENKAISSPLGKNLLTCSGHGSSDKSQCSLLDEVYVPDEDYEIMASFSYEFNGCDKYARAWAPRLDFRVKSLRGESSARLEYGGSGIVSVVGSDGFYVDEQSSMLRFARHPLECSFIIRLISTELSKNSRLDIEEQISSLEELLGSYERQIELLETIIDLKTGFDLIEKLNQAIANSKLLSEEIYSLAKSLTVCTSESEEEPCNSVLDKVQKASGDILSFSEKILITKLERELSELKEPVDPSKILTPQETQLVKEISEKKTIIEEAEAEMLVLEAKIEELNDEIVKKEKLLAQ